MADSRFPNSLARDLDEATLPWAGLPRDALLWEPFGEESLVYNSRSGETHLLNGTAADVLKRLQDRSQSLAGMVESLCEGRNMEAEEKLAMAEEIRRILREFRQVGLIHTPSP